MVAVPSPTVATASTVTIVAIISLALTGSVTRGSNAHIFVVVVW